MEENKLEGPPAEIRMTIEITRAATGLTETHELIGTVIQEPEEEEKQ